MSDRIMAPWTDEQVEALNRFQTAGFVHEFTCPHDHGEQTRVLVAHREGWRCPSCNYTQDWAHAMMLERPIDPTAGLAIRSAQDGHPNIWLEGGRDIERGQD